jgi:hypothetical protein
MDSPKTISTIAELESIAQDVNNRFGEVAWWRGHAVYNWELKAKIFRKPYSDVKNKNMYMNHFQARALCMSGSGKRPDNDFEWLCLAQHSGLPTRLLDWSESPLTALYFALHPDSYEKEKLEDSDGCLWALSPTQLNIKFSNENDPANAQHGLVAVEQSVIEDMVGVGFGKKTKMPHPKLVALQPWESNNRLIAQTGRFTIHDTNDSIKDIDCKLETCEQIVIPQGAKKSLRATLRALGVHRWNIFPDLDNLAKGLIEDILEVD